MAQIVAIVALCTALVALRIAIDVKTALQGGAIATTEQEAAHIILSQPAQLSLPAVGDQASRCCIPVGARP